jgi:hypothetical protein
MRLAGLGYPATAEPNKRMGEFRFYFGRRLWVVMGKNAFATRPCPVGTPIPQGWAD